MATQTATQTGTHTGTQTVTPQRSGPNTPEAFIADREIFWKRFTHFVVFAVIGVAVLLIAMAIFLV